MAAVAERGSTAILLEMSEVQALDSAGLVNWSSGIRQPESSRFGGQIGQSNLLAEMSPIKVQSHPSLPEEIEFGS